MKSIIKLGQVYSLKLNSGEEVVSKVVGNEEGFLELEDPVSLAPSQTGMALIPSIFSASLRNFFFKDKGIFVFPNYLIIFVN